MSRLRTVPRLRLTVRNDVPLRPDGDHVVYWMTSARRTVWNHALDRAIALAAEHRKPLIVLEGIRCDAPWSSDRFHRFVIDGMAANAARFAQTGVAYHPYVEPSVGAGRGLLAALARRAVAVVTDERPGWFFPRMLDAAARSIPARLEAVDGNGVLPLRATDRAFPTAYAFRRHLQATVLPHLSELPTPDPLATDAALGLPRGAVPADVAERWRRADDELLAGRGSLAHLPIDHAVGPVAMRGGADEASRVLARFIDRWIDAYDDERNHPDTDAASGISPWLHFGHLGGQQAFAAVAAHEVWTAPDRGPKPTGSREGWWGMRRGAEAFVDQVVTWRELGHVAAFHDPTSDRWDGIPDWARRTLDAHRGDARPRLYSAAELESAATHDRIWNAAQNELVREGRMQNYLRMLWAKKTLEWSRTPEEALATLVHLNNKWAVDARDPNSYSGILWCFGRYDRPWGPERPVFGTVRYMSSDATARKLRITDYIRRYAT